MKSGRSGRGFDVAGCCCSCPGMRHAFGKPSGRVARVAIGQVREQASKHTHGWRHDCAACLAG